MILAQNVLLTISSESFQECTSLQSVYLGPKNIPNFTNIAKTFTSNLSYINIVLIGDKSFCLCKKINKLNIMAKEVIICDECFYDLNKLCTIKIIAPLIKTGQDSFYNCQGSTNMIIVRKTENENSNLSINYNMKNLEKNGIHSDKQFKNDRKFNSFYVFGINRYNKKPSYISMFPAFPVTLNEENIKLLPNFCYPQGIKPVPSKLPNESNIITGFVFYFGCNEYIGVALHIYIPPSANSFVGIEYDRSYPFCICSLSNNPDIASHFSFLYELVDPIIGKNTLPEEPFIIPDHLQNSERKCIMFLHLRPNSDYIALSPLAQSMNFLLPKLINYYNSQFLKYIQNDFLIYPTLQTFFTFLSPQKIVELFLCSICDLRLVFLSNDLNKLSFCILALASLVKCVDIQFIFPCLPIILEKILETPVNFIIGYVKSSNEADIDVNLDTGEIFPHIKDGIDKYSVIHNFVNESELGEKAESLFIENLNNFLIPEKNLLNSRKYLDFIKNADKDIYPECFQFFAKTKYILIKKFIKEFTQLIKKPFFSPVESFIRNYLLEKNKNPEEKDISFIDFVDVKYKEIMQLFKISQTFEHLMRKNEQQVFLLTNTTEPQIEPDPLKIIQPLHKSGSCPSFQRNKSNTPKSKKKSKPKLLH